MVRAVPYVLCLFVTVKSSHSASGSGAILNLQGDISPHASKSHICLQYLSSNQIFLSSTLMTGRLFFIIAS